MNSETFSHIRFLEERSATGKTFSFRYEIPEKGIPYYCVRDSKLKILFKAASRSSLNEYWNTFLTLLQNPSNPFREGQILYECIPTAKKRSPDIYSFYQVVQLKKKSLLVRPVESERFSDEDDFLRIVPYKDRFIGDTVLKLKIEIVQRFSLSVPEYGIHSSKGEWKILFLDFVTIYNKTF